MDGILAMEELEDYAKVLANDNVLLDDSLYLPRATRETSF